MTRDGIVLINKKINQVTNKEDIALKKLFNTKKVGHLGTLDPFATGLIICGINKGTKAFPFLEDKLKTYVATLQLGSRTTTLDLTGEIISTKKPIIHTLEEIKNTLNCFLGNIKQIPPMYSAVKINGVPLYKLAFKNQTIERKEREVYISKINLLEYNQELNTIKFEVTCSKGTYIRTLGEDIASKLNEYGHLISLERTKIGNFELKNANTVENITESDIIPLNEIFKSFPKINIDNNEILLKKVLNGNKIKLKNNNQIIAIYNENNLIAIYNKEENNIYKILQMFKND